MKLYSIFCLWKGIKKHQNVFEDNGDFWLGGGNKMTPLLFTSKKAAEKKASEIRKRWKVLNPRNTETIIVSRAEITPIS